MASAHGRVSVVRAERDTTAMLTDSRKHSVLAPNAKLRAKVVPHPPDEPAQKEPTQEDGEATLGRPMRLGRAKLLKRVFNLDLEHSPKCGRPSRAGAQDTVAGRHDALGDVSGAYATLGGAGTATQAPSDSLPRRAGPECQDAGQGSATSV